MGKGKQKQKARVNTKEVISKTGRKEAKRKKYLKIAEGSSCTKTTLTVWEKDKENLKTYSLHLNPPNFEKFGVQGEKRNPIPSSAHTNATWPTKTDNRVGEMKGKSPHKWDLYQLGPGFKKSEWPMNAEEGEEEM